MSPEQIRELRKELRLTAKKLAEELGLGPDEVFAWERGERFPTKRYVARMTELRARRNPEPAGVASAQAAQAAVEDLRFWALVRKLMAHEALLERALELAEPYPDPAED